MASRSRTSALETQSERLDLDHAGLRRTPPVHSPVPHEAQVSREPPPREQLSLFTGLFVALGAVQAALGLVQMALGMSPTGTLGHVMFYGAFCGGAAVVGLGALLVPP